MAEAAFSAPAGCSQAGDQVTLAVASCGLPLVSSLFCFAIQNSKSQQASTARCW